MRHFLSLVFAICLLRKSPEELPSSSLLLQTSLIAHGVVSMVVWLLVVSLPMALLLSVLVTLLLAALTYFSLSLADLQLRFPQTLTALTASGALLGIIALPVLINLQQPPIDGRPPLLATLLFWGLLAWNLAVMSHVLHHALSLSRWAGLCYAVGYLLVSTLIVDFFV